MENVTNEITPEEIECIKKLEPGWNVVFYEKLIVPQLYDDNGNGYLNNFVKSLRLKPKEKEEDFISVVVVDFCESAKQGTLLHLFDSESPGINFYLAKRIKWLYSRFLLDSFIRVPRLSIPRLAVPIETRTSAKVIGLVPSKKYFYRIRAVASANDGHFSAWTTLTGTPVTTEEDVSPYLKSVSGFEIVDGKKSSVKFKWNPVQGATDGYEIQFSHDETKWTTLKTSKRRPISVISSSGNQEDIDILYNLPEPYRRITTDSIAATMEKRRDEVLEKLASHLAKSKWEYRISPITVHAGLQLYPHMNRSDESVQQLIDKVHAEVQEANPECMNPSKMIEKEHHEAEEIAKMKRAAKKYE